MGELLVRNLTRRLGGRPVIAQLNLHIRDKEFLVLLGPERSGKTMLLRLISGLDHPDSGEIWLDNTNITHLSPRERDIGMVFQSSKALQQHLTVYENIASTLRNQGLAASAIEMQVVSTAHQLGIGPLLQRKTSTLSGGEQQRVALARVLARKARLYLFDEPLTYLDISHRHQAWQEIMMAHRLKSESSLFVTHEPREALAFGRRIAVFGYGRIHQIGNVDELLNAPANTFVAQYINTPPINIIHGYLQAIYHHQSGLRYRILSKSFSLLLPTRWNNRLQRFDTRDILLGLRADTLTPLWSFDASQQPANVAQATILDIEPHAKSTSLKLQLSGGEELATIFHLAPYQRLVQGQRITIGFDPERVMLFHPLTQLLLQPD